MDKLETAKRLEGVLKPRLLDRFEMRVRYDKILVHRDDPSGFVVESVVPLDRAIGVIAALEILPASEGSHDAAVAILREARR